MGVADLITNYWAQTLAVVGPIATYFVGKRQRDVEVKQTEGTVMSGELHNVQDALKIYREILDDLKKEFEAKLQAAEDAYKSIDNRLRFELGKNRACENKVTSLGRENKELIRVNESLMETMKACEFQCPNKP